jgi:cytoskeletal protein RodZ
MSSEVTCSVLFPFADFKKFMNLKKELSTVRTEKEDLERKIDSMQQLVKNQSRKHVGVSQSPSTPASEKETEPEIEGGGSVEIVRPEDVEPEDLTPTTPFLVKETENQAPESDPVIIQSKPSVQVATDDHAKTNSSSSANEEKPWYFLGDVKAILSSGYYKTGLGKSEK